MPSYRSVAGLLLAVVAAGCTINTDGTGARGGVQVDAGSRMDALDPGIDADGLPGLDAGPDAPPDTGRVVPCVPACVVEDGWACNTSTGTCACSGPSWCCSGCMGPGMRCNTMTHTCECDGTCFCVPCASPMVCGATGVCEPPPPPPCGGEGEMCCTTGGPACDSSSTFCRDGTCRHCGRATERCCPGRRCDILLECRGLDTGWCGL